MQLYANSTDTFVSTSDGTIYHVSSEKSLPAVVRVDALPYDAKSITLVAVLGPGTLDTLRTIYHGNYG